MSASSYTSVNCELPGGEDPIQENELAVIPNGVEFGVDEEDTGGEFEGLLIIVLCSLLHMGVHISAQAVGTRPVRRHPVEDLRGQTLKLFEFRFLPLSLRLKSFARISDTFDSVLHIYQQRAPKGNRGGYTIDDRSRQIKAGSPADARDARSHLWHVSPARAHKW